MKHWIVGLVLGAVGLVLLYASAAMSQLAPTGTWLLLLAFAVVVVGIFFTIAHASKHMTPNYRGNINTGRGGPRQEVSSAPGPNPWAGTGKTLGIMAVGLVGLLVYVGIYVGAQIGIMGWVVYLGVALSFIMLVVVVLLTAGKSG